MEDDNDEKQQSYYFYSSKQQPKRRWISCLYAKHLAKLRIARNKALKQLQTAKTHHSENSGCYGNVRVSRRVYDSVSAAMRAVMASRLTVIQLISNAAYYSATGPLDKA
jgi:hypothetical protein